MGFTDSNGVLNITSVPEGNFTVQAQTLGRVALGSFSGTVTASDEGQTIAAAITASPSQTKVLVASGEIDLTTGFFTDTAEVFDPATGSWTTTLNSIPNAPPANAGNGFCAANMAVLANEKTLFAGGGCSDQGTTTNAASLYDPTTNQWSATNFMSFGRDQFGMTTLNDGSAIAFAGCAGGCSGPNILFQFIFEVGNSAEIYNFQTNTWTTVASLNIVRGNMGFGNLLQSVATLLDGRVLACNGSDGFSTSYSSCEIYDPAANTWTNTGSIGETGLHRFVVLASGKVLTILNDGLTAVLFDPASGTWSTTGSLASKQVSGDITLLSNGQVLVSGGTDGTNPLSAAQIYDPIMGTWSATGSMNTARNYHVAVRLRDGRVLVAGGETTGPTIVSSAEIFDPTKGTWSTTGSMSQGRILSNAVAFTVFQ